MKIYILLCCVAYEGISTRNFSSMKDMQKWLKENTSSYEGYLGNVTIYEIEKEHNPYDISQGKFDE
jgi:hypothetical protein